MELEDTMYNDTPCRRPLGGCYAIDRAKTELLGRLVTCHHLHCCEPGHVHQWVYWHKGVIRYLDTEETPKERERRKYPERFRRNVARKEPA